MKKIFMTGIMLITLVFTISGCGDKSMTLDFAFGQRTGMYSGETENGKPNGYGSFTSETENGQKWTYEGNWADGHFEGEGKTTWESGDCEEGIYKDDYIVPMTDAEMDKIYSDVKAYKNHVVDFIGRVFTAPEYSEQGVALQVWKDIENSAKNTIVYVFDSDFEVHQNDYVHIVGVVMDEYTGQNALGGTISAPMIRAREYNVISYQEATSPTAKTINVNQTINQAGYEVTVDKVEFAGNETRVYVRVNNNGANKFSLYSFNSKITQNGRQFDEQTNYSANYPKIQTDLLAGNMTEGIIAFPAIEQTDFTLLLKGSSSDYFESLEDFVFDIDV